MGTNESTVVFIEDSSIKWEQMDSSIKRKVMAWNENLMLVKVKFDKGGVGALHQHHHSQISHIESGKFEIEIGGVKKVLSAGDVFYIPSNILHGAVCLEEGVLIDVFNPMRDDFIK
ncbi:MAG: cupin domain-containing protein [Chitinophagaceae bacterium]